MRILLLSAYHAASHNYWLEGLASNFPEHQWTSLTLPARYFSWRIRGNSLSWAFGERDLLTADYDLLISTSMVDLSALRGMLPSLAAIPTLVYFHENQFAYPMSLHNDKAAVEPQLVNLYTALCADQVAFNSAYNRDSFLDGVDNLLGNLPDAVPPNIVTHLQQRANVLPVPLANSAFSDHKTANTGQAGSIHIIWNHRWEYDKGPERLLNLVERLPKNLPLRFHIVGQQFRNSPKAMQKLQHLLTENNWLGHWGFIENKADYHTLLTQADIVLSTALHDFQGLSVLEACAAQCIPMVPNRLAYQNFIPENYRYLSCIDDVNQEAEAAALHLQELVNSATEENHDNNYVVRIAWEHLSREYQALFEKTMETKNRTK